jgi:hypothetical protein
VVRREDHKEHKPASECGRTERAHREEEAGYHAEHGHQGGGGGR